jgi:hypothetical protein
VANFRSSENLPSPLRPWWEIDCFSQHHSRWLHIHCERHEVSCSHEQTYVLPSPSFQAFHWQVDIVLSIDGNHTFTDLVIATPTWIDLVSYVVSSHVVVMIMVTQEKEKLYHDRHLIKCIFSPYNGGFWLPTSTNGWFSSLVC